MQNIVLVGFMGSGKTTVGREIALLGGRFLLDTDQFIEQNMGKSVVEIFESVGESGFRRVESQLISWLAYNVKNAVIATGGGMPAHNDISYLGKIFWLDVDFDSVMQRLNAQEIAKRPMLSDISQAKKLYDERRVVYEQCSHYAVGGNALASDIAREILTCFEETDS